MKSFPQTIAIILAGGQSTRAEKHKGLRNINHKLWIDLMTEHYLSMGLKEIYIGLGFDHETYIKKSYALKQNKDDIKVVINSQPQNGAFSTLQCILKQALKRQWNEALIMHIDHALTDIHLITKMIRKKSYDVVKPTYKGQSGHPIKVSRCFCTDMIKKPVDSQLNKEIRKLNKKQIYWLQANNELPLYNLNTKELWKRYIDQHFNTTQA